MADLDGTRVVAWAAELRNVHDRLRQALAVTREALAAGDASEATARDLLLFCHGFCSALTGHHEGEDRTLFPAVAQARTDLADTLAKLRQDHEMIGTLVADLSSAVAQTASPAELDRHLEGLEAIVESHFRFEERALADVLGSIDLAADPAEVLGPL